jgi:NADPH:quinone reductase-like Zn-dependent oxidoreductase
MRVVAIPQPGGPEVLEIIERPVPQPGDGEVRIRVAAATVNPTDIGLRTGVHAARFPNLRPPYLPGWEAAGPVDAVGAGTGLQVGERVMAIVSPFGPGGGAQAEYVVVPADSVARVPDDMGLVEAATLPMNGLTVRRALDVLALPPGATLAVTGAAGAVGGYTIELAALEGVRVIADAKPEDAELVRRLGADVVVPRGPDLAAAIRRAVPEGVDALLDAALVGPPALPAIRDGGHLIAVRPFQGDSERDITITLVLVADYLRNGAALAKLVELAATGKLTLRVADTLPVERVAEAHRRLEQGGVRGRLVLTF